MARVKVGKFMVDVKDKDCPERKCFELGFDKGPYVQGRGYIEYHKKPRPVCWRRYEEGCPSNSICPKCRTLSVLAPGRRCEWSNCDGILISDTEEAKEARKRSPFYGM